MSNDAPPDEPNSAPGDSSVPANDDIKAEAVPPEAEKDPLKELEAKVATLQKQKKDNWDRYLRAAGDLENMRKRQRREIEDAKFDQKSKILKEMLPVVDNLERAIEHASQAGSNPIVEG